MYSYNIGLRLKGSTAKSLCRRVVPVLGSLKEFQQAQDFNKQSQMQDDSNMGLKKPADIVTHPILDDPEFE